MAAYKYEDPVEIKEQPRTVQFQALVKEKTASKPAVLFSLDPSLSDKSKLRKLRKSLKECEVDDREVHNGGFTYTYSPQEITIREAYALVKDLYPTADLPEKVERDISRSGFSALSSQSAILEAIPGMRGTLCTFEVPRVVDEKLKVSFIKFCSMFQALDSLRCHAFPAQWTPESPAFEMCKETAEAER